MSYRALLALVAIAALVWLAAGGVYATRPGGGNAIYRVNRITGAVSICSPAYEVDTGKRVVRCATE